jgi:hypothetical protein
MPSSTSAHSGISGDGHVAADTPLALKDEGSKALNAGDTKRAAHMYTLGIDLILKQADATVLDGAAWFARDTSSGGVLHQLLSNRSLAFLKAGDAAAAAEDAEHCCLAKPDFAKGHLRLLAALAAMEGEATLEERQRACLRGIRACPANRELRDAKANLDLEAGGRAGAPFGAPSAEDGAAEAAEEAAQIAATRLIADDASDPRRAMAAGDVGSALALGAYGLPRDLAAAERYLRIGADGGDAGAQRNLGMLLLSRAPEEAAQFLEMAARQGDESAAETLQQLGAEANQKRDEALFKLRALADRVDARAIEMLSQFEAEMA